MLWFYNGKCENLPKLFTKHQNAVCSTVTVGRPDGNHTSVPQKSDRPSLRLPINPTFLGPFARLPIAPTKAIPVFRPGLNPTIQNSNFVSLERLEVLRRLTSRFMCLPLSFHFVTGFTVCVILWSRSKCLCCSALLMPLSRIYIYIYICCIARAGEVDLIHCRNYWESEHRPYLNRDNGRSD